MRQSLYFGGGAGALAAGTVEVPAVNIFSPLTDAIFEPLAARQQVERARFDASATANQVLLEVAELHFELLAAEADLEVRRESATQEAEVARLTRAYAEAGQGREADAQRAATEFSSDRGRNPPGRGRASRLPPRGCRGDSISTSRSGSARSRPRSKW